MLHHKSMPGVSMAFRKSMKGRFGCGGSSHPRLRVTCASASDCGPCGGGAGGCNILGSTIWYCQAPTLQRCRCIDTVFHEASHSCGIGHSLEYMLQDPLTCDIAGERACEIGEWFRDEFDNNANEGCIGTLQRTVGGVSAGRTGSNARR